MNYINPQSSLADHLFDGLPEVFRDHVTLQKQRNNTGAIGPSPLDAAWTNHSKGRLA